MNQADTNGKMISYWVMPFRDSCVLTIINYGLDTILVRGAAGIEDYKWKPESMYFGASWHEYYNINSRDHKRISFRS